MSKVPFVEVHGRDLAKILAIQHWNIGGMALSRMGIVDLGGQQVNSALWK